MSVQLIGRLNIPEGIQFPEVITNVAHIQRILPSEERMEKDSQIILLFNFNKFIMILIESFLWFACIIRHTTNVYRRH